MTWESFHVSPTNYLETVISPSPRKRLKLFSSPPPPQSLPMIIRINNEHSLMNSHYCGQQRKERNPGWRYQTTYLFSLGYSFPRKQPGHPGVHHTRGCVQLFPVPPYTKWRRGLHCSLGFVSVNRELPVLSARVHCHCYRSPRPCSV